MTDNTLIKIREALDALPSFLDTHQIIFTLCEDADGSYHHPKSLEPNAAGVFVCKCNRTFYSKLMISSSTLFKPTAAWGECILEAGTYGSFAGFMTSFKDLLFVFEAAAELKNLNDWDTLNFEGLIKLLWGLTATGLISPSSTAAGSVNTDTGLLLAFKHGSHITGVGTGGALGLTDLILGRLSKEFKGELIEHLGGIKAKPSSLGAKVLITFNQHHFFWDASSKIIKDATKTYGERTTELLKIVLLTHVLAYDTVTEHQPVTFAVDPDLLPVLDAATLRYHQVFTLPFVLTRPELHMLISFVRLYSEGLTSAERTSLQLGCDGGIVERIFEPALFSYQEAIK